MLRARVYAWLGGLRIQEGNAVEAIRLSESAIEEAKRAGAAADSRSCTCSPCSRRYARPAASARSVYSPRALAIYEEHGNLGEAALKPNNLGVFAALEGRWTEGAEYFRRAEEAWSGRATALKDNSTSTAARSSFVPGRSKMPSRSSAVRCAFSSVAPTDLIGAIASVYGRFAALQADSKRRTNCWARRSSE